MGDGFLNFDKFYAAEMKGAPKHRARRIFNLIDRNGDGKLSVEELESRPIEAWFLKLDTDGDGTLSLAEFTAEWGTDRERKRAADIFKLRPGRRRQAVARGVQEPAAAGQLPPVGHGRRRILEL